MAITLIIANGSALVRTGLKALLSDPVKFEILAEVTDRDQLESALIRFRPNLVLIDQTSKGFDVDDIRRGKRIAKRSRFLAITPEKSAQVLLSAIRAGVTGYVKTDCGTDEILDAVVETAHGRKFFCGQILEVIQNSGIEFGMPLGKLGCDAVVLSDRELEVIRHIAEGATNAKIAETLFLSTHTINAHRRNIMQKLGVNNTAAVVMYAVKAGLVNPNKYLFSPGGSA